MPFFDDLPEFLQENETNLIIPSNALCLKVPRKTGEELVVHRDEESREDYVFLFEALDDAQDYALMAHEKLGIAPQIRRVRLCDLHFRVARFKPAVGEPLDLPLSR